MTMTEPRTSPEVGGMGHSVKRKEDPRFIRGAGEYIDDVNLPGQLWLDIVRSPYAHATIKSIDSSEALKVPGVLAVITGKDLEGYGLHWMPTLAGDKQMVLPTDTVMYQSQEVAAVIATSRYAAADGVAAVFEHPGFYPYLSGTRNLSLLARMDGRPAGDAARARAIERVGLTTAADRRVDGYSAGMRQRLGLAAALLRGPRLLLLDEPTSALDPAGARDVRELVRELAAAGVAIVISSHDLVEVEELCTSVTILRAGDLVFSGSLEHLRARAGDDAHHLATSDDDTALAIARDCRGIRAARTGDCTHGFDAVGERDAVDAYVVALGRAGIAVRVLQPRQRSLESVFLRLTSTGDHQ